MPNYFNDKNISHHRLLRKEGRFMDKPSSKIVIILADKKQARYINSVTLKVENGIDGSTCKQSVAS